ncbi:GNAT family N-acetyltransferase [Saccharibacillus sp. CPCC 101409]|uniref:GNAT family N-acetyltransferase n=1 Tax=Saccharibacillus sp. CPCC 101409 TaxID=3058041 RepID=UPI002670DAC3|nr:GNAT family N-acetyltransferase [Saccharibacillus sp. CPCC 101409]MDO3411099.1 GNAT family N-acetyltransferase [Saccharibacillus sp. CPCC 101409]
MNIRIARPEDAAGIAQVHVDSWKTTYKGIVSDAYLDSLSVEERWTRWEDRLRRPDLDEGVMVAENERGQICGFLDFGQSRETGRTQEAELYAVYLLQSEQRKGVGRKMFRKMVAELKERGYRSLMVWVLEPNPAVHFYKRLGAEEFERKEIRIGDEPFTEIAFCWNDIDRLTV